MSWNYRVFEWEGPDGEKWRTIHEVFYDGQGNVEGYEADPAWPIATQNDAGTFEDLGACLDMIRSALDKPTLLASDLDPPDSANAPPEC